MSRVDTYFLEKTRAVVDLNKFNDEAKSLNSKIEIVLKFGEDKLRFTLSEELTSQEEYDLDSFISSFEDGDPEQKIPLIYDIAKAEAKGKHFHNINYKIELTQSLIPEREAGTVKGEVREVFWYKDMDASDPQNPTPVNPVLRTNVQYFRDSTGFATHRVTTRTYYNRDGSENSEVKTTTKFYYVNRQDMIKEGKKRRGLLVDSIQIPTMNVIAEVLMPLGVTMDNVVLKGRKFMDDYESDFNKFIDNSSAITDPLDDDFGMKTIIVKLRDENDPGHVEWLDKLPNSLGGSTTIRDYLMSEFDI